VLVRGGSRCTASRTSRLHACTASSTPADTAKREPIRIHPDDADVRGIRDGDVVRVFNERGACLAGAIVTEMVRPRVVNLSTGAWFAPDVDGTCVHGNPNVLTTDRGTSRLAQGCTGQHVLVQVERYEGEPPPVRIHEPPELTPR
jgi:biotin/methionine sulfoxide reductase